MLHDYRFSKINRWSGGLSVNPLIPDRSSLSTSLPTLILKLSKMLAENKFKNIFANSSPTHILFGNGKFYLKLLEIFSGGYNKYLPLPHLEWNEIRRCEEVSIGTQKAIWIVFVGLLPVVLVHVNGILKWKHLQLNTRLQNVTALKRFNKPLCSLGSNSLLK